MNNDWDVIIIGTGLIECIIASGLSLRGYSVLVLDSNKSYGGSWNTVKFSHIHNWLSNEINDSNNFFKNNVFYNKQYDKEIYNLIPNDKLEHIQKINIDLLPKLLFSRGKLVEIILSCGISNYLDFQGIEDIFYGEEIDNNIIEFTKTPFSKKEIFSSTELKLVEKREIMRLFNGIKNILELTEIEQQIDIDLICDPFRSPALIKNNNSYIKKDNKKINVNSFLEFQDSWKISDKVLNLILYTIVFNITSSYDNYNWEDFAKYFNLLLLSLNQHGCIGTPFIYPNYGICDLPQAFSRLAAVKGSTQRLDTKILKIEYLEKCIIKIQTQDFQEEILKCKLLISSFDDIFKYDKHIIQEIKFIEKYMLCYFIILSKPLILNKNENNNKKLSFTSLNVNLNNDDQIIKKIIIYIFQCDYNTCCCPNDYYIVYINTILDKIENKQIYQEKIESIINILLSKNSIDKNNVLYKANYIYKQKVEDSQLVKNRLLILSDPSINNNSFFLLDNDIENSLKALKKSINFLNPDHDNEINHLNFSNINNNVINKDLNDQISNTIIKKIQDVFD